MRGTPGGNVVVSTEYTYLIGYIRKIRGPNGGRYDYGNHFHTRNTPFGSERSDLDALRQEIADVYYEDVTVLMIHEYDQLVTYGDGTQIKQVPTADGYIPHQQ